MKAINTDHPSGEGNHDVLHAPERTSTIAPLDTTLRHQHEPQDKMQLHHALSIDSAMGQVMIALKGKPVPKKSATSIFSAGQEASNLLEFVHKPSAYIAAQFSMAIIRDPSYSHGEQPRGCAHREHQTASADCGQFSLFQ